MINKKTEADINSMQFNIRDSITNNSLNNTITEIKNNLLKLEKIVEENSLRINTFTSLLERFLNQDG